MLQPYTVESPIYRPRPLVPVRNDVMLIARPDLVPEAVTQGLMTQVNNYVHEHNSRYPGSMYDRGIHELTRLFQEGHAVTLLNDRRVAYFGAMIPRFPDAMQETLGHQVVELANSIVPPDMQQQGLAKLGNQLRMSVIHETWGPTSIGFFTTENRITAGAWHSAGANADNWQMEPVDWAEFPYFAGLTCQYSAKDPTSEHVCALQRRCRAQSTPDVFNQVVDRNSSLPPRMDCTLMVSSRQNALEFQERARMLHEQLGGQPVVISPHEEITDQHVLQVDDFYAKLLQEFYGKHS